MSLQKKLFHIIAFELAWRGGEVASCKISYFEFETGNNGLETGRVEYNPIFSKTAQGGGQKLSDSKWLTPNIEHFEVCPVRLFKKLKEKRGSNIKTDRFFLTPNPFWKKDNSIGWYKNLPIGISEISKWTKESAVKIGMDVKRVKITNNSNRAAAVSELDKSGIGEQSLAKITGHSNVSSIKPYLQLGEEHHSEIINSIRRGPLNHEITSTVTRSEILSENKTENSSNGGVNYNNCVIYNNCTFN